MGNDLESRFVRDVARRGGPVWLDFLREDEL